LGDKSLEETSGKMANIPRSRFVQSGTQRIALVLKPAGGRLDVSMGARRFPALG